VILLVAAVSCDGALLRKRQQQAPLTPVTPPPAPVTQPLAPVTPLPMAVATPQAVSQAIALGQTLPPAAATTPNPALEAQLYQQLDLIGQQNGGVVEGHSNQVMKEMEVMNKIAADPRIKTICETGFNGGHGTLRWLLHSNPQAHVYSFDIGVHGYSRPAAKWLEEVFPGRHTATWGDSTQTIPVFRLQHPGVKCNLIFVDGGHDYPVAVADLQNFMPMADPEYNVVMIDDVYCGMTYCQGPNVAWVQMVQGGQIVQTALDMEPGGARGFALGSYRVAGTQPPPPIVAQTVPVPAAMTLAPNAQI